MLIDDSGKCIIGTFGYGERWGNSIVTERERVYNMFGVEKLEAKEMMISFVCIALKTKKPY